jgi:CubicO group peptidase (beta-lactamase class C family)
VSGSVQITATAVALAVQEGVVKLDAPVTTYLPDFQVDSRYEEHPAQKITLRRLLNCTAGTPGGPDGEPLRASFRRFLRRPRQEPLRDLAGLSGGPELLFQFQFLRSGGVDAPCGWQQAVQGLPA